MNNLTKHETVWLQAYCAAIGHENNEHIAADLCLKLFTDRFPPSPPPQKESVSGLAQDRQEFWIYPDIADRATDAGFTAKVYRQWSGIGTQFHVTELREGEVIVTKEMLAKAWNEKRGTHGPHDFERFCKALGIKP